MTKQAECRLCATTDESLFDLRADKSKGHRAYCRPCESGQPSHKWCSRCRARKPISEFHRRNRPAPGNYQGECKACAVARMQEFRDRRPYYFRARQYGLTEQQLIDMLEAQNYTCGICDTKDSPECRLGVDHDHETDRVRGLLCLNCNSVLGYAEDSLAILESAIRYLKKGIS